MAHMCRGWRNYLTGVPPPQGLALVAHHNVAQGPLQTVTLNSGKTEGKLLLSALWPLLPVFVKGSIFTLMFLRYIIYIFSASLGGGVGQGTKVGRCPPLRSLPTSRGPWRPKSFKTFLQRCVSLKLSAFLGYAPPSGKIGSPKASY